MAAISTISISPAAVATSPSITPRFSASFSSSKSNFLTSSSSTSLNFPCLTFNSRRNNNNNCSKRGFSCNCIFGLGVPELVVIAGVAALVFGPKKLPEVGKSIGKTVKSFQQAAKEFESELKKDPEPEPVADPTPAQKVKEVGNPEEKGVEISSIKEN